MSAMAKAGNHPARYGGGFTLVEAVVALTILALVMLVTVTALRTLANTQVSVERRTADVDEIRSVSSFLRDLFESAVVGQDSDGFGAGGGSRGVTYFRHHREGVELKSTILFGEGYGGSYVVRVAREADALVLRWQELVPGARIQNWSGTQSRVLVAEVEELAVSTKREHLGSWLEFDDSDALPALLRLQMKSRGRPWPDLIFNVQR